jgi:hypothetical protein
MSGFHHERLEALRAIELVAWAGELVGRDFGSPLESAASLDVLVAAAQSHAALDLTPRGVYDRALARTDRRTFARKS